MSLVYEPKEECPLTGLLNLEGSPVGEFHTLKDSVNVCIDAREEFEKAGAHKAEASDGLCSFWEILFEFREFGQGHTKRIRSM